jgi:3-deoxy-manno-octulosonate cytidylyltransferase (CMP-KDO synthetase)
MSFNVVIPARLNSSRLKEKVLIEINGIPMVIHVAQRASLSDAKNIIIATDDKKIGEIASQYNFKSVMTNKNHISGTDRCLEAADISMWSDQDIIVNVQADEPLIDPALIDLVAKNVAESESSYVTACSEFRSYKEFINPNNVKVVLDNHEHAIYFSRSPIPYSSSTDLSQNNYAYHHLGIYAYRLNTLKKFCSFSISELERIERLEQLRALSNNLKLKVMLYDGNPIKGVDTLEDLNLVREMMAKK